MAASSSWSGLFVQHPVGPAEGVDPLASGYHLQPATGDPRLRIGYAAFWEPVPKRTWSGSTWHLREALRGLADTVDIGVEFPTVTRTVLKGLHTRYRGGRLTTSWWRGVPVACTLNGRLESIPMIQVRTPSKSPVSTIAFTWLLLVTGTFFGPV